MKLSALIVGVDVPWVTSWSEEAVRGVRPCPTVGGRLAIVQEERAGYGRPQYSLNHFVRQRVSVARMLCPMCGAPTAEDDRWTQTARRTTAGALRVRGLGDALPASVPDDRVVINAGSIAPSHRACAERALEHCPHLRADAEAEILRFPSAWTVHPLQEAGEVGGPASYVTATPAPRRAVPVVSFLQLCGVTRETDARWRRALRR